MTTMGEWEQSRNRRVKEILNPLMMVELTPEEFKQIIGYIASRVRIFPSSEDKDKFLNFYNQLEYYIHTKP